MRRRVFNLLTILSLLLAFSCVALWIDEGDDLTLDGESISLGGLCHVSSFSGMIAIHNDLHANWGTIDFIPDVSPVLSGIDLRFLYYRQSGFSDGHTWWTLAVSSPVLIGLFSIPPGAWLLLWYRHRRRLKLAGINCLHCGYDLRASSDACPECGRAIPSPTATRTT